MSSGPNTYVAQFGEISSNSYENIVFTRFFGSMLAVTLTFDPQSTQHIYEPKKYSCDKIGCNSLHCLSRYDVHKVFGTHTLTDSLTDGHIREQNTASTE